MGDFNFKIGEAIRLNKDEISMGRKRISKNDETKQTDCFKQPHQM